MAASVTGRAHAVPPAVPQAAIWQDFFAARYRESEELYTFAERVFAAAGISERRTVADPRQEDVSEWGTGARMDRYLAEALPLGKEAVTGALAEARLDPGEVGLFAVVSCTGYATPGLHLLLARDLGMAPSVRHLMVGHMGCYAALPGIGACSDFVTTQNRPAVLLCVELTSLHIQPPSADPQQVVAHALFSDAAAAVVFQPATPGLEVLDLVGAVVPGTDQHMTWDVTDLGFRMGLSPEVPDVLGKHIHAVVADRLLAPHGLTLDQVEHWAIHPGGRRVVEVVEARLGLSKAQSRPSYAVLNEMGNCSSATVLLVLERLQPRVGEYVVAMSFGPGLSLYAALLRAS